MRFLLMAVPRVTLIRGTSADGVVGPDLDACGNPPKHRRGPPGERPGSLAPLDREHGQA